ncbi:hypothetical protein IEO21_01267 [Rhodonia placenta]|uniref:BTB domain-containing protein n=1 Tax=Rhodonia placenta TaxID=104341 RepID=A0A8H7PA06_9APHY|nr:hypothetical protein IEO21_01267 [Postia placenta]
MSSDSDAESVVTPDLLPKPKPICAESPFNRADADVTIRSSNAVDFRVHSNILVIASPFFESMFSFPQPCVSTDNLDVVEITEDSRTLDTILRICYPVLDPEINTLGLARSSLQAALKYDMQAAIIFCKRALQGFIPAEPLRVYAIACLLGTETGARKAAIEAVSQGAVSGNYIAELEELPAGCYHRLLRYQRHRSLTDIRFTSPPRIPTELSGTAREQSVASSLTPEHNAPHPFDDVDADTMIVTSDDLHFHVHGGIVALASPVLKDILQHSSMRSATTIRIDEDSATLTELLLPCYPFSRLVKPKIDILRPVLRAAEKYKMNRVIEFLRELWTTTLESSPLRAFLLAVSVEWRDDAEAAAKLLLQQDYTALEAGYTCDMETTSAGPYFRLLQYHKRCTEKGSALVSTKFKWLSSSMRGPITCGSCKGNYGYDKDASWVASYVQSITEKLGANSLTEVLQDELFLYALGQKVGECSRCQGRANEILAIHYQFKEVVAQAIAEVRLSILLLKKFKSNLTAQVDVKMLFT